MNTENYDGKSVPIASKHNHFNKILSTKQTTANDFCWSIAAVVLELYHLSIVLKRPVSRQSWEWEGLIPSVRHHCIVQQNSPKRLNGTADHFI